MTVSKKETTDFVVGKGKLLFQEGETFTGNYRDLGEAPEVTCTIATEVLEYFSARSNLKKLVKKVITQIKVEGKFKLSDVNVNNLVLFFLGDTIGESAQGSGTDQSATLATTSLDCWRDVGAVDISNVRVKKNSLVTFTADDTTDVCTSNAHGLVNGNKVMVSNSGGALPGGLTANTVYYIITAATNTFQLSATEGGAAINLSSAGSGTNSFTRVYKEDTDYELDAKPGMIRPLTGGAITEGDTLVVVFDRATATLLSVNSAVDATKRGFIKFVANPGDGRIQDFEGFIDLQPEGDLSKVGDDWQGISFNMTFLEHSKYKPSLIKTIDRGKVTA